MKNLLTAVFLTSLLLSCNDNTSLVNTDVPPLQVDVTRLMPKVENGYLVFEKQSDFDLVLNSINLLEKKEMLEKWERIEGFTSMRETRTLKKVNDNESILRFRKALSNSELSRSTNLFIIPQLEPLINHDGIVRVGNSLVQITNDNIKVLSDIDKFSNPVDKLILADRSDMINNVRVDKIAKYSLVNSNQRNARLGPFYEIVQGSPAYVYYGYLHIQGELTCVTFSLFGTTRWLIDATSRLYSDANDELTGVETEIFVESSTHSNTQVSGPTPLSHTIYFGTTQPDFKGKVTFKQTLYPFGAGPFYSIGIIEITD